MTGPTIEEMSATLMAAGWKRKAAVLWKSPDGRLFLGPYGAWKVMTGSGSSPEFVEGQIATSDAGIIPDPENRQRRIIP